MALRAGFGSRSVVWRPLIHGNRRNKVGTTKDRFLRGHYTYEGHTFMLFRQARSQVSRFGGAQYIFRGKNPCFYCMFKSNFSGRNKILVGAQKKFGGTAPECPPWLRACFQTNGQIGHTCAGPKN